MHFFAFLCQERCENKIVIFAISLSSWNILFQEKNQCKHLTCCVSQFVVLHGLCNRAIIQWFHAALCLVDDSLLCYWCSPNMGTTLFPSIGHGAHILPHVQRLYFWLIFLVCVWLQLQTEIRGSRPIYVFSEAWRTIFLHKHRSSVNFGGKTFLPKNVCMKN